MDPVSAVFVLCDSVPVQTNSLVRMTCAKSCNECKPDERPSVRSSLPQTFHGSWTEIIQPIGLRSNTAQFALHIVIRALLVGLVCGSVPTLPTQFSFKHLRE